MKCPSKSLDVFEFREEDGLHGRVVRKSSTKVGDPYTKCSKDVFDDHASGTEIQSKEVEIGLFMGTDTIDIDYNHDATGSPTLIKTKDYALTSGLNCALHNGFKSNNQAADVRSDIIESGSVFAGMDMSVILTSDADESIEKSPSTATSSDGPSSQNCSGWNLDSDGENVGVGVVFYPDYLEYGGAHYLDSIVRFTRSFIEGRSKLIYGKEKTFHIHLEVEDIVKIESQWSAWYGAGTISIYFISKDAVEDKIITHDASGIQELKFPVVDSDWYEKQEAIESLNVKYKAVWHVLLDTGMENCSALPEGKSMILTRSYFPNFSKPFREIIYPKGDPDAVSVSKRDVDLLLPNTFVNDTIIDFYIKYLKTQQSLEERNKFHFFNSFFFRKLADMDKDPSSAFDGKAAFQRVRKWTRKVNLLEKDFIFIPVNYNYHWSLIVICYFGDVANYEDAENKKLTRVPCILHMDSLRGNHLGLQDLIQSYLWEEWKERQKGTCEDLYSKFRNLKFIPLELPQQQNSYDCGIFLLHYVERFLEGVPTNFNIYKITPYSKFLQADWFPHGEASMKRTHIERLISDLLDAYSEDYTTVGGSSMQSSPACEKISCAEFVVKPGPSRVCPGSLLCEVRRQGIDTTLFSNSSKSTECVRPSGFGLKGFEQASASEAHDDTAWGTSGNRASPPEFIIEEGVEASDHCVPMELAQPSFQHLDGVNAEAVNVFPSSSGDFRSEPVHGPLPAIASSSVVSGERNAAISCSHIGAGNQACGKFLLKDLSQEVNPLQASQSSAFVSELETPNQMVDSNDHAEASPHCPHALTSTYPLVPSHQGGLESVPETDEQHTAKRMRIVPHESQEEPVSHTP